MNKLPNYQQEMRDAVDSAWTEVCVDGLQHLGDFVFGGFPSVVESSYRAYNKRINESDDLDVIFCCSCFKRGRK